LSAEWVLSWAGIGDKKVKIDPKWLLNGLTDEQVKGVITVSWRALLLVHIAWACGWLGYIGLGNGFAQAADFEGFKLTVEARRVKELNSLILDTKAKQCSSVGEAWRLYYEAYNDLRAEYKDLTNREYPDPPCTNFR
jgi:hypothetical protein